MYQERICSLCIETNYSYNNHCRLIRIADLDNGEIIPFDLYDVDYGGQNINSIFNPKVPEKGKICLWDWEAIAANKQHSYINKQYRWIEYRNVSLDSNPENVIDMLTSGMEHIDTEHDYLFSYNSNEEYVNCLFVSGTDFQIRQDIATLKDKIGYLFAYKIDFNDILEISNELLPNLKANYYRYIDLPEPIDKIYIKDKFAVIKDLITAEIKKYVGNGTNSDRKAVRNFLDILPDRQLGNSLAQRLGCDLAEAQTYVAEFLQCCEKYFTCEDYNSEIMKRLINSNTDVANQFKNIVQQEWQKENNALVKASENELKAKQAKLEELNTNIQNLTKQETAKKKKITELNTACQTMRQTIQNVELEVQERIVAAQQNIAHFFAEYAMFMPYSTKINSFSDFNANTNKLKVADTISDTPQDITDLSDLFDCLTENIETTGVDKKKCKPLAAYVLAAYFLKEPLILAGYGAILLLEALSATLNNKKVLQIYELKKLDEQELKQLPTGSIIGLHNTFDMTLVNKLVSENTHLYFAIISPTIEELAIEPKGIYSYALPLFAEYFIKSEPVANLEGYLNSYEYSIKDITYDKKIKNLLPDYLLPTYAKQQCFRLASMAKEIYNYLSITDILAMQVLPLILLLKGVEKASNYIDKQNLTDNEKSALKQLLGEEI